MKPKGILMVEHRRIEKYLQLVKSEIDRIDISGSTDPYFIFTLIDFFRNYADKKHHGKEEDILFRLLEYKKLSKPDQTVMNDLMEEHITARRTVSELLDAVKCYQDGDLSRLAIIKEKLRFLDDFYPRHISKEDKIFFPNVDRYFSDGELEALSNEFNDFDRQMTCEKYDGLTRK